MKTHREKKNTHCSHCPFKQSPGKKGAQRDCKNILTSSPSWIHVLCNVMMLLLPSRSGVYSLLLHSGLALWLAFVNRQGWGDSMSAKSLGLKCHASVHSVLDSDLTFEHVGVTCWRMRDHMEQSQVIPAEAILKQPVLGHTINRPKSHEHTQMRSTKHNPDLPNEPVDMWENIKWLLSSATNFWGSLFCCPNSKITHNVCDQSLEWASQLFALIICSPRKPSCDYVLMKGSLQEGDTPAMPHSASAIANQ